MDFRYLPYDGAPPPPIYLSTERFSYAPLPLPPPPVYYGKYPLPPPSGQGYFYSRPFIAGMLPWGEEYERERTREEVLREVLLRGYCSFLPYRPPKDPFLEREYEKERIREEVLREEVRRRVIEKEVRWELAMERYYNLRHSNPGYNGTWRNVQFEQPRFSHGCETIGPSSLFPSKRSSAKWGVGEVKPSTKKENQKKKDKQTVQIEELLKVAGTCGSKRKVDSISAFPTAATSSSNSKVGPKNVKKQKVDRKEYSCTSCQITTYDNHTWLEHLSGKRHQKKLKNIANVEMSKKELLEVAETCGSKRKHDSISARPTPAATSNSSNEACGRKVKKQKVHKKEYRFLRGKKEYRILKGKKERRLLKGKKEYSCTFCQLTVDTSQAWLFHLNGKKHRRNTLEKLTNVDMTKKVSSDSDDKSTPGVVLSAVKVEMDNGDSLATKPTEELQTDKEIIKKKVEFLPLFKKTKRGRRRRNINSKF